MGVTGLWRLIDASGKPVPVETLEGKILAIDISIWIHQVLQGYQDRRGNAVPNAHLLGLYTRICKLLYFKIKPVFVFDGGVPLMKKNTIAARKKHKAIAAGKAAQMKNDLLHNLMKHSLVKGVLSKKPNDEEPSSSSRNETKKNDKSSVDIFKLPQLPADHVAEEDPDDLDTSNELSPRKQQKWKGNIHTVDVTCDDFKSLPPDVRYDILTDLKETRKQNSWGRLHEIPEESNQFSNYQMERLLKRRNVQVSLEAAEQEMGGKTLTLDELEKLMTDQGVDIKGRDAAYRIASDSATRMIYVNDIKALKSSQEEVDNDDQSKPGCSKDPDSIQESVKIAEDNPSILFDMSEYVIDDNDDDWDSDIEFIEQAVATPSRKKYFGKVTSNPALAYMLENTELSQEQILELIEQSRSNVENSKKINGKNWKNNGQEVKGRKRLLDSENEGRFTKKKKEFDFSISDFVTIKEEIVSDDDDDGDNVVIDKTVVEEKQEESVAIMSESDSDDDFIEVQGSSQVGSKAEDKKIEITIKENQVLNDDEDIFADVFSAGPVVNISSNNDESFELSVPEKITEKIHGDLVEKQETGKRNKVKKNSLAIFLQDHDTTKNEDNQLDNKKSQEKLPIDVLSVDKDHPKLDERVEELKKILPINSKSENIPVTIPDDKLPPNIPETILKTPEKSSDLPKTSERVSKVISLLEKDKEELLLNSANEERLLDMQTELETENKLLREDIGKFERQSTEVTAQMRSEAQELLRLFGIPYIVAPQEAEAQCAYLETLSLTDGTITDDSDIWLFGGRCVYKNFFNNTKQVMQYQAKDIERHFKLSRNQMIQLALLVGSDYTVGVPGIGPVTALEVLASFPSQGDDLIRGLENFSAWLSNGRVVGPGKATLRNKLKNVTIDRGFPSQAVVQAYLFPTVDESTEKFTWDKPNIVLLGDYTRKKFGWTKMKFDETMGPVLKKLNEQKSQKNLLSYFKVHEVPKSIEDNLSKRVQKAVQRMGKGQEDSDDVDDPIGDDGAGVKKRKKPVKKSKKTSNDQGIGDDLEEKDCGVVKKEKKEEEIIPQREKDRQIAMKKKLQAIEIFKKSKKSQAKSSKNTRPARRAVKEQANLSESSSEEN